MKIGEELLVIRLKLGETRRNCLRKSQDLLGQKIPSPLTSCSLMKNVY